MPAAADATTKPVRQRRGRPATEPAAIFQAPVAQTPEPEITEAEVEVDDGADDTTDGTDTADTGEPEDEEYGKYLTRIIDGFRVVDVLPVLSNLPVPEGRDPRELAMRSVVELVMEDGSHCFACSMCEYTGPTRGAVQSHRSRKHNTGTTRRNRDKADDGTGARRSPTGLSADVASMSLGDILSMGQQLQQMQIVVDNLTESRDAYRKEAMGLREQLRKLENALHRAGFQRIPDEDEEA